MIFEEKRFEVGGKELVLRSATEEDTEMLMSYLKQVCGETRFLMFEEDEVSLTLDYEKEFIRKHMESDDSTLIIGLYDGEYIGNCSFNREGASRRNAHRAGIGIALFQKFTGLGLGRIMLTNLLEFIKSLGYEQVELIVIEGNDRARHLYESVGFVEYGRRPNANKYDDGTYADDILMVLQF
ncbi:MAG: GNAT family N-acetyltransferase [Eubacterium sp.]|nr:GNAT family N-acetyltransferase [Eubacterium sp.]